MAGENWSIDLSPEVDSWYSSLSKGDRDRADDAFNRLLANGPQLRMPHSRSLGDGLHELRFKCQDVNTRVTYHRQGNEFRTLTVFRKQRQREKHQVDRARDAMRKDRTQIQALDEKKQGARGVAGKAKGHTKAKSRKGRARERTDRERGNGGRTRGRGR